jgi:uncharacterized protein (TIGR02231 family)
MKKIIFSAIILFIAAYAFASTEKTIKSSVKKVTVFTQAAQVFRSSNVSLNPGVTDLVFTGISPFINAASVQAGGKGNFIVLEVKHNIKYPEPPKPTDGSLPKEIQQEIKQTEDSLSELGFTKEELFERKNALQMEKDMIMKNKLAHGEGKSDSLAVLKQAMEFFRLKLNDINSQLGQIKRKEKVNADHTAKLTARLNDLKTYKNSEDPAKKYEPTHEVIITVSADEAVTAAVELSYMVSQAGWTPSYDLRSSTSSAPVQLTYKANVYQNSGEEWNDVKLKLSTGNPNKGNIKPVLPPWYLNYFYGKREVQITGGARSMSKENVYNSIEDTKATKDLDQMSPAESAANYSQMIETMTNVEFDIKLSYSIPSDGKSHMVSIKNSELPANYYHFLVPKMDSEAFLIAKVTGWENLNLLPGRANVFYEGTYVGETVLNPSVINDTLELALGRDNGITVTRTKLKDKESNKLLGNEITKTISYELRMKNNKSKAVNLLIEDQLPLSQNKDIKIEMKDVDKADYNDKTGLLKWNTTLETKGYKTLTFSYAVTYNKDMPLSMY